MNDSTESSRRQKIYCEKCDKVFDSKAEYERHADRHAGGGESCPIDAAVSKFLGMFRRR